MKKSNLNKLHKAYGMLCEARALLEDVSSQERDSWNDKSCRWQDSEKGQDADTQITEAEEICDSVNEYENRLGDLLSDLGFDPYA